MEKHVNKVSEEAKLRDAILEKFRGNETFLLNENPSLPNYINIQSPRFYQSINSNVYVVENLVRGLLADDMLTYNDSNQIIKLSHKGFYIISKMSENGYVAKEITELKKLDKEKMEKTTNLVIQLATLLIAFLGLWLTADSYNNSTQHGNKEYYECNYCHGDCPNN